MQVNQGLGQSPGHSYGGIKQSGIGREFSLEGMLDSFTQRKNVTVNLTRRRGRRADHARHRKAPAPLLTYMDGLRGHDGDRVRPTAASSRRCAPWTTRRRSRS